MTITSTVDTSTPALREMLSDIERNISFVQGLSDEELGQAHTLSDGYLTYACQFEGGSVCESVLSELIGWDDFGFATTLLLDGSPDNVLDTVLCSPAGEVDGAEELLTDAINTLSAELFAVKVTYQRTC